MVGGVIGNYRILRSIGEGGMGAVYVAEHALIGRQAAIKVLLREMSWRQDLVTRFFNEARAATAVKHPGIVEVYDFGYHTDGSAYIVMEYLEGESLSVRLQRTGTLSEVRASAWCRQVAGALGAAHAKGIVHRDLKPDNIYIVRDPDIADGERTKILDFGIAKLTAGELRGQSVTRTGSVMGTPPYMSPEQCKDAGAVDHRADLYALGCILFEMMCGRPPFVADSSGEIIAQHIYAPVPRPSSIAAVTPQIEEVILRALVKQPSQRFQSADEMIAALRSAVPAEKSAPAWPAPPRPTPPEPTSSGPMSSALPQPAAMIAIGPQLTTLSQASASASAATGAGKRRRAWQLPAVATVAIAVGAVAITLGVRRGERDAPIAAAPQPAPTAAAPPRMPGPPPTSDRTSGPTVVAVPSQPSPPTPAASPAPPATHAPEAATPSTPAVMPAPRPPSTRAREIPTPAPARITIKLISDPAGADVYRMPKGVRIGRTPFDYAIDAEDGPVALTLKKPGYSDEQISVPSGRDSEHKVTFAKIAVKSPPPAATSTATGSGSGSADAADHASATLDPFEKLAPKKRRER